MLYLNLKKSEGLGVGVGGRERLAIASSCSSGPVL